MLFAELIPSDIAFDPNRFWGHFFQWAGTVATVGLPLLFAYLDLRKRLAKQDAEAAVRGKVSEGAAVLTTAVALKTGVTKADVDEATTVVAVKKVEAMTAAAASGTTPKLQ